MQCCSFSGAYILGPRIDRFQYPVNLTGLVNGSLRQNDGSILGMGSLGRGGGGLSDCSGGSSANNEIKVMRGGGGKHQITGHSMPLVALGGFILVMGFMAFNGGSKVTPKSLVDLECNHRKLGRKLLSLTFAN